MEIEDIKTEEQGKTVGIMSYLTIIGWLIAYFTMHKEHKTELGSYHLRQNLLLFIVALVAGIGSGIIFNLISEITGIYSFNLLSSLVQLGVFILWIIGFMGAIKGEKKPIPFIGSYAQRLFSDI